MKPLLSKGFFIFITRPHFNNSSPIVKKNFWEKLTYFWYLLQIKNMENIIQSYLDEHYVKKFIEQGFDIVPKVDLTDGTYLKVESGYSIQLYSLDKKHTGYHLVTKSSIRGMWMGQPIEIEQGTTPSVEVYKILFNVNEIGKEGEF